MVRRTGKALLDYNRAYIERRTADDPSYKAARFATLNERYASAEAKAAREAVRRAILAGKITRPENCEKCGEAGRIEAAHADYSRRLAVRWLCRSCHVKFDRVSRVESTRRDAGPHNRDKTHCPKGHPYIEGNVYYRRGGRSRICATCKKDGERQRRQGAVKP